MTSNIIKGGRATITINGKVVGTFDQVSVAPSQQPNNIYEVGTYDSRHLNLNLYACWDCGHTWNFSNSDHCLNCDSYNLVEIVFR